MARARVWRCFVLLELLVKVDAVSPQLLVGTLSTVSPTEAQAGNSAHAISCRRDPIQNKLLPSSISAMCLVFSAQAGLFPQVRGVNLSRASHASPMPSLHVFSPGPSRHTSPSLPFDFLRPPSS